MFVDPGVDVYEGMIIGMNSRKDDMVVNPTKNKKLTNVRASGSDDAIKLNAARTFTLEEALEFIDDDELVEITPDAIRPVSYTHLDVYKRQIISVYNFIV